MEEALKLPFIRCTHCNKTLGHMRKQYAGLIAKGKKPFVAFKILGLTRYCCKMDLANPSQIAPGLVYNNPRQEGSIKFASQDAVRLLGELSIAGDTESLLVTIRQSGTEISISRPTKLSKIIGIQERGRHTSTATLPGISVGKEREPRPTEQNEITSENFSPEMIKMFRDGMTGGKLQSSSSFTKYSSLRIPSRTTVPTSSTLRPTLRTAVPTSDSLRTAVPTSGPLRTAVPTSGPLRTAAQTPDSSNFRVQTPGVFPIDSLTGTPIKAQSQGEDPWSEFFGLSEEPEKSNGPETEITPVIMPTDLAAQPIDVDSSTTQNLFLPTIIKMADPDDPDKMIMIRQFSGV